MIHKQVSINTPFAQSTTHAIVNSNGKRIEVGAVRPRAHAEQTLSSHSGSPLGAVPQVTCPAWTHQSEGTSVPNRKMLLFAFNTPPPDSASESSSGGSKITHS